MACVEGRWPRLNRALTATGWEGRFGVLVTANTLNDTEVRSGHYTRRSTLRVVWQIRMPVSGGTRRVGA